MEQMKTSDTAEITKQFEPVSVPAVNIDEIKVKANKKVRPEPVIYKLTFSRLFWVFIIGAFIGVVIEVLWCLATNHRFESRQGLIYGWFNLVYGFGAVAMTVGLQWLAKRRDLLIFFGGFIIGSAFEYICSLVQEILFGTVSWQYDHLPFNLNGRVNLLYSMFWGLLALIWVKNIFPYVCRLVDKIPGALNTILIWILTLFMIFNTFISGAAVARMSQRRAGAPAPSKIGHFLDEHYPDDRLQKIFPNMVYTEPDNPIPVDAQAGSND